MRLTTLVVVLFLFGNWWGQEGPQKQSSDRGSGSFPSTAAPPASFSSPIGFVENVGQFEPEVRFQIQTDNGTLFATDTALWLSLIAPVPLPEINGAEEESGWRDGVNLRLRFMAASINPQVVASGALPMRWSYFRGDDPRQWRTDVPVWSELRYVDLYPGIDLRLTTVGGTPTYQLVVTNPAIARLDQIQFQIDGANSLHLNAGQIVVSTAIGRFEIPLLSVVTPRGDAVATPLQPTLSGTTIARPFGLSAGTGVAPRPDPSLLPSNLLASTFVGGGDEDWGQDIAIDSDGNAYIIGDTTSLDFPTTPGAWDTQPNTTPTDYDGDLFIVKVSSDGTELLYGTYLGGSGSEYAKAITVDSAGSAYVTGYHYSSDFPVTPGTNGPYGGGPDTFVVKLGPQGNRLDYVVFLGGTGADRGSDIAVDAQGAAYVTGYTDSLDFTVTPGAWDTVLDSDACQVEVCNDGFVTKISPSGMALAFSTFLGGNETEYLYGLAVDSSGAAYVTGSSRSDDYPTTPGVFQPQRAAFVDVVVTKFHPSGATLLYSTFVGGNAVEMGHRIAVDQHQNAYVTGQTVSSDFPISPTAFDPTCGTDGMCNTYDDDGFVLGLNPYGSSLLFSTYFGSSGNDLGNDIGIDYAGNVYVVGIVYNPDTVVTTPGAFSRLLGGSVILKLSPDGSTLMHGTSFGGDYSADLRGIAIGEPDAVYVTGLTGSPEYPTTPNAFDPLCGTDGTCNYIDQPDPVPDSYAHDTVMTRIALPAPAVTVTLSTAAGELNSPFDHTQYQFAAGTFTETVVITHAPRHPLSLPPVAPLVARDHVFANYAIASSSGVTVTLEAPYTLTIAYDETGMTPAAEATVALYYWDEHSWVLEPSSLLNIQTHTVTATPTRFGWWALLHEPYKTYLPLLRRSP